MGFLKLADYFTGDKYRKNFGYFYYEADFETFAFAEAKEWPRPPKRKPDNLFAHTLMTDEIMQQFDIGGLTHPDVFIEYPDLPRAYPVRERADSATGEVRTQYQIADAGPIYIRRRADNKKREISAIEADTGTMTMRTGHKDRSAMVNKYNNYIELLKAGKIPGFILTVTRTQHHMNELMGCIEELTESDRQLRAKFLFDTHPVFGKAGYDRPLATGDMLTRPKKRVAHPDLKLDQ